MVDQEVHHQDQRCQIVHQGHHLQLIAEAQVQILIIIEAQAIQVIIEVQVQIEVHHLHVLQVDLTIQDLARHQEEEVLVKEDNCNLSNISNPKRTHLSSLFLFEFH